MTYPRKPRFREIGIHWSYWFSAILFTVLALGAALLAWNISSSKDKPLLIGSALFFGVIASLAFLWPLLRISERKRLRFTSARDGNTQRLGIFLPLSQAKRRMVGIVLLLFGGAAGCLTFRAESYTGKFQATLALIAYSLGLFFFSRRMKKQAGIMLTESGLFWRSAFGSGWFVPWESLEKASAFQKKEQHVDIPAFGIRVRTPEALFGSDLKAQFSILNANQQGFHLSYTAENLLWPVKRIEELVWFYWRKPELRQELSNGIALHRANAILAGASQEDFTPQSRIGQPAAQL